MRHAFFCLSLLACLPQTQVNKPKASSLLRVESPLVENEEEKKNTLVNPMSLHIYSPVVSSLQELDGSISSFIRFNTNGETDFVKYKLCPLQVVGENSACQESFTPELGFIVPGLFAGKVQITLTPCVTPDKSSEANNCGESKSVIYDSHRVSLETAKLLIQKISYEEEASSLILEYKSYLATWLEQAKMCAAQQAKADELLSKTIMIVEEFIKGPIEYFPRLILENDAVYENFTQPIGQWVEDFKNSITQSCKEDDKTEEDQACQTLGMIVGLVGGIAEGMVNPLPAVGYLIQSVTTLTDPANSIPLACKQEEKLSTAHFQYESRKTLLITNYKRVTSRLEELGVSLN